MMTFSELRLVAAIHNANLGGADFISKYDQHVAIVKVFSAYLELFNDSRFPFSAEQVFSTRLKYRKVKASKIKARVAIAHGFECFFAGRGKGACSVEAELGHVVPASRGGELVVENCQIECRAHNHQRSDMTIEEYLGSDLFTTIEG